VNLCSYVPLLSTFTASQASLGTFCALPIPHVYHTSLYCTLPWSPHAFSATMTTDEVRAEVRPSPIAGNGLFATSTIGEGELIVHRPEILVSLIGVPHQEKICSHCYRRSVASDDDMSLQATKVTLMTCTACKKMRYCSKVNLS